MTEVGTEAYARPRLESLDVDLRSSELYFSVKIKGITSRMHLKGMEKLREKLPDYPGKRIAIIPLRGIIASVLTYMFLIILDILPRLYSEVGILVLIEPFLPVIGSLFVTAFAFWLIGTVWSKREEMKAKYGDLAYQHMFPRGFTGVFLVPPIVFHAFTSIRSLPPSPPINDLTIQWSQSLLPLIGVPSEIDILLRVIVCMILLILGTLTIRSAILTFGLDYMAVVYLYFPEESEVQNNEIYSVVRHPTYLGGVLLGAAAIAFRFSVYSILFFIIIFSLFRLQARREEKELIERFGESYVDYMNSVPALLIKLGKLPAYFRFLAMKTSSSKSTTPTDS